MQILRYENRDGVWLFRYSPNNLLELFRQLGRFAVDRELEFDWRDCAAVSQRAQHQCAAAKSKESLT